MTESKNEKLQKKLFMKKENSWNNYQNHKQIHAFAENYKHFLNSCKTERLVSEFIIKKLIKAGFKDVNKVTTLKAGDKIFKDVRGKALIAAVVGKNHEELHLIGSHADSPRLDLKPNPLYEDSGIALMQTHYYGGIKKYQWVNLPMSLIGVIFTKSGKKVEIAIGENDNDPKFIIPDLLPHLSKDQMERDGRKIIQGEELNILVGNMPVNDKKVKERVKFTILKKLNDEYGLIEEDFVTAELEVVPSAKAMDIGFDKSMIAAYAQDDRSCVYTSTEAFLETESPKNTSILLIADKEETGSMGDTGAAGFILRNFIADYRTLLKIKSPISQIFENSKALSADVTAGLNPIFKDVHDPQNASFLGKGVSIEKYGGGGGKYHTQDAHAEYMSYLRQLVEKNKIDWQTGELGKIDIGGGGTIGMFMSQFGMDCADAGPCVLGMHSPCEVTSKADLYSSYLLYKAFYKN